MTVEYSNITTNIHTQKTKHLFSAYLTSHISLLERREKDEQGVGIGRDGSDNTT